MRRIVDTLYRVHHLIAVITDLDTLLERIVEESKQVARAEACSLILYDSIRGDLYFHIAKGESGDQQALKREIRLQLNQGVAGAAAATRQSINVENVNADSRFYNMADAVSRFTTRSLLATPMVDRETLIGVIEVVNKRGEGAFTDTDRHVMEMFATLAATAIANARLIEENLHAERMTAIGQAVAGLSHYTKNIITGMMGSTELIDQGLRMQNMDVLQRCWPIFKRSTNRIADCVQDMMAYSKTRAPLRQPCVVKQLIEEATQSFTGLLAQRQVTVETEVRDVKIALIDPQGIFRCLLNLLTNAADAVPQDTGRIRVCAAGTPDGALVIEVSDNGPGVPESERKAVFEPFFSTKGAHGTGLGLAVTQKIIQEHSGDISIERSPEGGALFRIVLPGAVEPAKDAPVPVSDGRKSRGKESDKEEGMGI
jgi:signal transduction histidine kinase